jgi:hypothetical protein
VVPASVRVADPLRHPGQLGDLGLHDRLRQDAHALAQEVDVARGTALRTVSSTAMLSSAIVVSSVSSVADPTTRG